MILVYFKPLSTVRTLKPSLISGHWWSDGINTCLLRKQNYCNLPKTKKLDDCLVIKLNQFLQGMGRRRKVQTRINAVAFKQLHIRKELSSRKTNLNTKPPVSLWSFSFLPIKLYLSHCLNNFFFCVVFNQTRIVKKISDKRYVLSDFTVKTIIPFLLILMYEPQNWWIIRSVTCVPMK